MDMIQVAVLIFILAGLALPVICLYKMHQIKTFKTKAIITTAVITNTEKRWGYKSIYYVSSFQYQEQITGAFFNVTSMLAKKFKPGDTIPLMYLVDNPAEYKIDFGKRLPWIFGFSIIFLGFLTWFCYWLLSSSYYEPSPLQ